MGRRQRRQAISGLCCDDDGWRVLNSKESKGSNKVEGNRLVAFALRRLRKSKAICYFLRLSSTPSTSSSAKDKYDASLTDSPLGAAILNSREGRSSPLLDGRANRHAQPRHW